ncbi:phage holin family protein [Dysgonomonas sp. 216]|uniref:phage holin family protein n=1 Tax=Dysgonomonas sp. 216 TaxID=2302934 RepID=UPI002107B16B|nr:phage holin family protein [Dysgonomonas sp. 216]
MIEIHNNVYVMTYTDYFLLGLNEFFVWAKWLLLLAAILTVADLVFGVRAAKHRGEVIRKSRALKRTLNKISSYVLWIILAYIFGNAFGKPFGIELLPLILLLVIYGVELESIFSNYFEAKGMKVKINIFKLFSKKTDIIEIEEKDGN